MKHLAASKFWLPRDEGRTVLSVGSVVFLFIFPFFSLAFALFMLSSCLNWFRLVTLLNLGSKYALEAARRGLWKIICTVPLYTLSEGSSALLVKTSNAKSLKIGLRCFK